LNIRGALSAAITAAIAIAASAAVPVTAAAASAGSRAGQPARVPRTAQVRKVNLHADFERLSGHRFSGVRQGIVPPRHLGAAARTTGVRPLSGGARAVPAASGSCTEPNCNLVWHGGAVEQHPKVYVVFWGPNWNSNAGEKASANYLLSFYQGLGTTSDTWSTITSQYAGNSGSPVFNGSVFAGSEIDTAAPPNVVTEAGLAAEAASAASSFGIPDTSDDQVVVVSQSGTCFNDGFAGTCTPQANWAYCAWHSATSFDNGNGLVSFTNLPYQLDAGASCGENWQGGVDDGFSTVGGHEYAEAVTDPFPNSGWVDTGDNVSGGEIGDKCAWGGSPWGSTDPYGQIHLSTGTFAVQSLWDNSSGSCIMNPPPPPPPPPAATSVSMGLYGAGLSGTSISVPAGTGVSGSGVLAGGNAASATGTVSYNVYSDASCSTLVNAGPLRTIATPGTLPLSPAVSLTTPGTYYWKVSYSGDSNNVASTSTCGPSGAVETVQAPPPPSPTSISLTLSGGGKSGAAALTVPAGTAVTGHAALSGSAIGTATGTVRYYVYPGTSCSGSAQITAVSVTAGSAPPAKPLVFTKPGTYTWRAVYSGDSTHQSSVVTCGTVKLTVTAAPVIDSTAAALAKSAVSASVSTTVANDLLVAYVTGKGPAGKAQLATVTASGLKWTLVGRSDAGRGDAEVWSARAAGKLSKLKVTVTAKYAGWPLAMTVVTYQNASGIGAHVVKHASTGAPSASLTTTAANSWVFAVGDDWAKAAARTAGAAQRLIHQVTDSVGDTYWVQATNAVTAKSGTKVTINDTKPTADPYNLVLVEIR
jgi:serine protease